VRSSRTQHLILVKPDGWRTELAYDWDVPEGKATQDLFAVSPDGALLAYASNDKLHVRSADGSERLIEEYVWLAQMRFSADSKYLAAITGAAPQHLVVLELATGETRELATFAQIEQIEWLQGGIVASIPDATRGHVLVEFSPAGAAKTLLEGQGLERFVTASEGSRVVVFRHVGNETRVQSFDAAAAGPLRDLRTVHDPVTNAALSRDGRQLAFATALALFTSTGDGQPEALADSGVVHSVWFARDGRLGYASPTVLTLGDRDHAHRIPSDVSINMLRFDPVSGHALIATANSARDADARNEVASAPANATVLGVDRYAGGVVLWASR